MSDFQTDRQQLLAYRAGIANLEEQRYGRRMSIKILEKRIRERIAARGSSSIEEEPEYATIQALQEEIDFYEEELVRRQPYRDTIETIIDAHGDPKTIVEAHWNDQIPVLLAPVRVQARFVQVKHLARADREHIADYDRDGDPIPELHAGASERWSRSAPHLINLEHLVGTVAEEHRSTVRSWERRVTQTGWGLGDVARRRWWRRREDAYELLVRIYPDDIFVHGHEENITHDELRAGQAFWEEVWRVERELPPEARETALIAAWEVLQSSFLPARAAWIHRVTRPTNFREPLSDAALAAGPDYDYRNIGLKTDAWTKPLRAYDLPDKFVIRLEHPWVTYHDDRTEEVVGNRIVYPLALSHDPSEASTEEPPAELDWITDFEAAERIGLGIRVPISQKAYQNGFKKLTVLGVNTSLDENQAAEAFETLLQNHVYKQDGMSFLPIGTATNNFGDRTAGFAFSGPAPADLFPLIHRRVESVAKSGWFQQKDAHYLGQLLGIRGSGIRHMYGADNVDISGALAMNHLLWEGTWGYYLQQFFTPLISADDLAQLKSFFLQFVTARGLLPSLQIGRQPYGILTTTNYAALDLRYTRSSPTSGASFLEKLYNQVLEPLDRYWQKLIPKVQHLTHENVSDSQAFLRMLSLQASAASFQQQPIIGQHFVHNLYRAHFSPQQANADKQSPDFVLANNRKLDKWNIPFVSKLPYGKADYLSPKLKEQFLAFFGEGYNGRYLDLVHQIRFFQNHYVGRSAKLYGGIVDEGLANLKRPLITNEDTGQNYLETLATADGSRIVSHFAEAANLREEEKSLLQLLATFALGRLYVKAGLASTAPEEELDVRAIDFELEHLGAAADHDRERPQFLANHDMPTTVPDGVESNRWAYLESAANANLEGELATLTVRIRQATSREEVQAIVEDQPALGSLALAKLALELLQGQSALSLQHYLTEHLDLCHYRLDAWLQGLVHHRLLTNRAAAPTGLYLGAYGFVEELKKGDSAAIRYQVVAPEDLHRGSYQERNSIVPVLDMASFSEAGKDLDEVLSKTWVYLNTPPTEDLAVDHSGRLLSPVLTAAKNEGFIHTPSRDHAVAAAILRSGYTGNNPDQHFDTYAVNLSSRRVREALQLIEGIKQGQTIAALLGYRFERLLREESDGELQQYLLEFREAFPIETVHEPDTGQPLLAQGAIAVVDGLQLVHFYRSHGDQPVSMRRDLLTRGVPLIPQHLMPLWDVLTAVSQQLDAVSDLLLSESVFQVAKGNLARAANTLKMYNNEADWSVPEITQLPQRQHLLSHLLGIVLDTSVRGAAWGGEMTPLAQLCPEVNHWIADQLPPRAKIVVKTRLTNNKIKKVDLVDLEAEPIDFVSWFRSGDFASETSPLSRGIRAYLARKFPEEASEGVTILYDDTTGFSRTQRCLYSLLPLIGRINELLASARPMLPHDWQRDTTIRSADHMPTIDNTDLITTLERLGHGAALEEAGILAETNKLSQWQGLQQFSQAQYGDHCIVVPRFRLANAAEISQAHTFPDLLAASPPLAVDEWTQGVAQVREAVKNYQQLNQYSRLFELPQAISAPAVLQLPVEPVAEHYRWLGLAVPAGAAIADDVLSLVLHLPPDWSPNGEQAGLAVDTWKEDIPQQELTTGVAMHYNQPNNEAPQSLLLCVSPTQTGQWRWDDLFACVDGLVTQIKKRAIDPELLMEEQPIDQPEGELLRYLLPAVVAPICYGGQTPWANFGLNNPPPTENDQP